MKEPLITDAPLSKVLDDPQDPSLQGDLLRLRMKAAAEDSISLQGLIDTFGSESKLLLMIFMSLMNLILSPLPGQSAVFGIILVWISVSFLRRKPLPKLPKWAGTKTMPSKYITTTLDMMAKWHLKTSQFIRPRMLILQARPQKLVTYLCLLWLSIVILAPIPFGNTIAAFGIIVLALGQAERDGCWIIAGWTIGALHFALPYFVIQWLHNHPAPTLWW
jgi:hypothetical protein